MANPVGDGARRDLVPEDLRPTGYPDVGRDHGRPLLVAGAHKLEKQVGAALVDVEVAQLVDYEELRGGVALESLLEYTARLGASPSPAARSASRRPRAFRAMLGGGCSGAAGRLRRGGRGARRPRPDAGAQREGAGREGDAPLA